MSSAIIAVTVGMIVVWTILLLLAAFLDRHRGRQIERDLAEMEREHRLQSQDRHGSFDHRTR